MVRTWGIALVILALGCSGQRGLRLQAGDYLSNRYIRALRETRSPLAAGKVGILMMYHVRGGEDEALVDAIFNFHEGGLQLAVRGDETTIISGSPYQRPPTISVVDQRHFAVEWLGEMGNRPEGGWDYDGGEYSWVGNATSWVAREILTGRYRADSGESATFLADDRAVFPDGTHRYEIGLDHVEMDFDYIRGSDCLLAFRFQEGALLLFGTFEDSDGRTQVRPKPRWSLRRVN